ncbi:hypothetical protein niasHS_007463 [Heterodera schachtii]|uniref:F-box domain-containing protein n=1 Tax=Heterodera schachtii TaxID=97005 RepID=A0ABD2JY73_HETSC
MDALPAELILAILARLSCPEDILNCKFVSQKFHRLINTNAANLARPLVDCSIKQIGNCCEIEINGKGQKRKWQIEGEEEKSQQKRWHQIVNDDDAVALRPFRRFEFGTIALFGPFSADGISLLIRWLQFSRQTKIRAILVENFNFDNVQSTQRLFGQMMQQKCERLHLKKCIFHSQFVHCSLLNDHSLNSLNSFAQFQLEDENYADETDQCLPIPFLLFSMSHLANSVVRLRPLSSHLTPLFLWDSFVPLASSSSSDQFVSVSDQFLSTLATFVRNWQNALSPPSFHFRLRRVPPHFSADFCSFCDRIGISQLNLVFPSLFRHSFRIQCKENKEKRLFELFSRNEMKLWPTAFCLITQQQPIE